MLGKQALEEKYRGLKTYGSFLIKEESTMNYKPLANTDLEIADTLLSFFYADRNNDFYNLDSKKIQEDFIKTTGLQH